MIHTDPVSEYRLSKWQTAYASEWSRAEDLEEQRTWHRMHLGCAVLVIIALVTCLALQHAGMH